MSTRVGRDLKITELTSRISSAYITDALRQLSVPFDAETRTSARFAGIQTVLRETKRVPEVAQGERPTDVALATSMLQVGVDVGRLGLMVVTGQPKNIAEYIQASSRVGRERNRPGLVLTLFNWSRPRDLAYYESFAHTHATLYRRVEALSVTPYARRCLDRGTASAVVAALRNRHESWSVVTAAQDLSLTSDEGRRGMERLPACRGRHPHQGTFAGEPCDEPSRLLILGASNQWFGKNVLTMSVPPTQGRQLDAVLDRMWERLQAVTSREVMEFAYEQPNFAELQRWTLDEVWAAMVARRSAGGVAEIDASDLLGPDWEVLTQMPPGPATEDFSVRRVPVPEIGRPWLVDLHQVERLRLVRALVGFTRFDAPDPQERDLVQVAPLSRATVPEWVPATEVRGEGIFVRQDNAAVRDWEERLAATTVGADHRRAFARFRQNRYSDRLQRPSGYDWGIGWPGLRYYLVHTLAHVTLRPSPSNADTRPRASPSGSTQRATGQDQRTQVS
jgi:hypothetical protein